MKLRWILLLTGLKHLITAGLLLVDPYSTSKITSNVIPFRMLSGLSLLPSEIALVYGLSALIVCGFFFTPDRIWRHRLPWYATCLAGSLVQQFLLILSAVGSGIAIATGTYLDGTVVGVAHTLGDQDVYVLIAVLHAFALLGVFAGELIKTKWEQLMRWYVGRGHSV